jgi:protein dithiol oxidoreductase (disulfide-forming)
MKRVLLMVIPLVVCMATPDARASPRTWVEGRNYALLDAVQPTHVAAGKVEVLEVFSYGCPACNRFQPVIEELERSLPANAQMAFLPASFSAAEDMPMFQRAFFAAQSLGIARQAHQAIFDAVWKTGELAVFDSATNRPKSPLPTIEDAARCYARITGIKPVSFLGAAHSFAVEVKMRSADVQVIAMQVPGTPCLIINGEYRVELDTLTSAADVIDIVKFLVSKSTQERSR